MAGISDTIALGILNEAIGLTLPILVAPHTKDSLAAHPAFERSLATLDSWGAVVLANEAIQPGGRGAELDWTVVVETAGGVESSCPSSVELGGAGCR